MFRNPMYPMMLVVTIIALGAIAFSEIGRSQKQKDAKPKINLVNIYAICNPAEKEKVYNIHNNLVFSCKDPKTGHEVKVIVQQGSDYFISVRQSIDNFSGSPQEFRFANTEKGTVNRITLFNNGIKAYEQDFYVIAAQSP